MSPDNEINSHLKDSLAAKAANNALLKWHMGVPAANLHELEEMYNKFYEYFYEYYDHHSPTSDTMHHYHHYDGLGHSYFNYPHSDLENHYHHHHHIYHNHKHFNILDFLTKKVNSEKSI